VQHRAEPGGELDEAERRVGLETPVENAHGHDREPDREGRRAQPGHLTDRREQAVGVDDDEPAHEEHQHRTEDSWGPTRPQVHSRSIVAS
jgi:hypothetical protein